MKIKLLIFGVTGMLGNMMYKYFSNTSYEVTVTARNTNFVKSKIIEFDCLEPSMDCLPIGYDFAINCIGAIKHRTNLNTEEMVQINSLWPWRLSRWCSKNNIKLIHITTDCVFSGTKGKYVETDFHDAIDVYGKSKSLGECADSAMVIRASVIGEETSNFLSLVSWAKSQKNKTVSGFKTHVWNGLTTYKFSEVCKKIIDNNLYKTGLYHVFACDDVTKFDLLSFLNKKFDLKLTINASYPKIIDRSLRTIEPLCAILNIPTVSEMVDNINIL